MTEGARQSDRERETECQREGDRVTETERQREIQVSSLHALSKVPYTWLCHSIYRKRRQVKTLVAFIMYLSDLVIVQLVEQGTTAVLYLRSLVRNQHTVVRMTV